MDTVDLESASVKARRRRFSEEFKNQVVKEMLEGRDSVSVISRRYDINANQLFMWRRHFLAREAAPDREISAGALLPIEIKPVTGGSCTPERQTFGRIEIALGAGRRITVHGEVHRKTLGAVLEMMLR